MGDDGDSKAAMLKQLQFPIAILGCLQAGSIFYLALYFDFIKEKYKIQDDIFQWFDFMLSAFSLFGIIPGLLLKWLAPKKTAVIGGILIVLGQMLTAMMVSSEHEKIRENPSWILGTICGLSGQGACMILLASLQALMNMMTIQASHVVSTCLIAYYLGADSFLISIKDGLFDTTSFTNFTMGLAIVAFVFTLLNALVISDDEDATGLFGKAEALTKGVIYKKTNYAHLLILIIYTIVLTSGYFADSLSGETTAMALSVLVLLNLFVPLLLLCLLEPDRIKRLVGEPSDIEKQLSNKGTDLTFKEAAQRLDFWYLAISCMIVIGSSRMFNENAEALSMHDDKLQVKIEQTYGVFQVIGVVEMGTKMTWFRSWLPPSRIIIIAIVLALVGQLAMLWPNETAGILIDQPILISVAAASIAEGGLMVALASFVHEEYGTESFGLLYGTMLAFGGVGLYAFDEIFFPNIFEWYAEESAAGYMYFKDYGQWNVLLFGALTFLYFVSLILATVSHISVQRRDSDGGSKLNMIQF